VSDTMDDVRAALEAWRREQNIRRRLVLDMHGNDYYGGSGYEWKADQMFDALATAVLGPESCEYGYIIRTGDGAIAVDRRCLVHPDEPKETRAVTAAAAFAAGMVEP